jgi:hypothetical protein
MLFNVENKSKKPIFTTYVNCLDKVILIGKLFIIISVKSHKDNTYTYYVDVY